MQKVKTRKQYRPIFELPLIDFTSAFNQYSTKNIIEFSIVKVCNEEIKIYHLYITNPTKA